MTRPVSNFINPEEGTQEFHAVQKALREKPRVVFIGQVDHIRYFEVTSTNRLGNRYVVRTWEDDDRHYKHSQGVAYVSERGQFWVECSCLGAYPPVHPFQAVIAWLPKACYHMASVLIFESDQHK